MIAVNPTRIANAAMLRFKGPVLTLGRILLAKKSARNYTFPRLFDGEIIIS
jgi:hypothetical protein